MTQESRRASIYVGNLCYETTKDDLARLFSQAGPVTNARVVTDGATGRSRGFGYCEFADEQSARTAIVLFNDDDFNDRPLRVSMASRHIRWARADCTALPVLTAEQNPNLNRDSFTMLMQRYAIPSPPPADVPISIACPFCSLPFRTTPLLLSCGHSLCEKCIGDFRWHLRWKISQPKCPICLVVTKTVVKNFILDEVVDKLSKEDRTKKAASWHDGKEAAVKLKKEIREVTKRNDDLEVEIVTWHELHDLKQNEIDDFRANNPDEILDGTSFLYFVITLFILLVTLLFCIYCKHPFR